MNKAVDQIIYCYQSIPGWRVLYRDFHALGTRIPAGFLWDGASAPFLLRWLVPKFHRSLKASCYHDYCCRNAKTAAERKEADKGFRWMLTNIEGMHPVRSFFGYVGVRVGAYCGTGVHYPHWFKDNVVSKFVRTGV